MKLMYFLDKVPNNPGGNGGSPAMAVDPTMLSILIPIMTLLGYGIFIIKVLVPVILVIVGMYDLLKAITSRDDDQIKKAQSLLVKKLIVGICVFLVISMVTSIMKVVLKGTPDERTWIDVTRCAFDPFGSGCKLIVYGDENGYITGSEENGYEGADGKSDDSSYFTEE